VKRLFAVLLLALFALAAPAAAQTFPPLTGRVVDQAGLLRPEQVLDIRTKSENLEAQTGRQFVVATVNSLEGREIEDYAYRLGRAWKIGDEKRDDGVILLVAPNERKVWITTGYGAGEFLTDAMSGIIVRDAILPRFKAGDMGGGIVAGADAIVKQMSLPADQAQANVAKAQQQETRRSKQGAGIIPVLFIMIIFFAIIGSLSRKARGRRYRSRRGGISPWVVLWGFNELSNASRGRGGWGGGGWGGGGSFGGGGGFGGFSGGGGSFGGGGAGGSW
jgi:uncharacterized protein